MTTTMTDMQQQRLDLERVRQRLDQLNALRLRSPFPAELVVEYRELCRLERLLLDAPR